MSNKDLINFTYYCI